MKSKLDRIYKQAEETLSNNRKLQVLIDQTRKKITSLSSSSEMRKSFIDQIYLLIKMIKLHFAGDYRAFSTKTILMFIVGLVYFVTPTDLLPDFIPVLGFTDDIALLYWIFQSFAEDIEQFKSSLANND